MKSTQKQSRVNKQCNSDVAHELLARVDVNTLQK